MITDLLQSQSTSFTSAYAYCGDGAFIDDVGCCLATATFTIWIILDTPVE